MTRLERVFELLEEKPRGKHCAGIAGIIEEGSDVLQEDMEDAVLDACLIASGQRAEHYEMAAYGTSIAWAQALELGDVAQLLRETLEEEKAADKKLSALAESGINEAATAGESEEEMDEEKKSPSLKSRQRCVLTSRRAARWEGEKKAGAREVDGIREGAERTPGSRDPEDHAVPGSRFRSRRITRRREGGSADRRGGPGAGLHQVTKQFFSARRAQLPQPRCCGGETHARHLPKLSASAGRQVMKLMSGLMSWLMVQHPEFSDRVILA